MREQTAPTAAFDVGLPAWRGQQPRCPLQLGVQAVYPPLLDGANAAAATHGWVGEYSNTNIH